MQVAFNLVLQAPEERHIGVDLKAEQIPFLLQTPQ
jgi:hypothetical protein